MKSFFKNAVFALNLIFLASLIGLPVGLNVSAISANTNQTIRPLAGHTGEVFALAFSPNGQLLASASGDQTIRLWDPQTGRLFQVLSGHTQPVRTIAFSPDSRFLASGSADATTRIWDIESGKELKALSSQFGNIRSLAFSPDGKVLATVGDGGSLRIWDWRAGEELKAMKSGFGIIFSVAFSPSGRVLSTGSSDTLVHVWDEASGNQQATFSGHTGAIHAVVYSPDGQLLASASADKTIRLWDPATGAARGVLTGHKGKVQGIAFSQDSKTLLSVSSDGTLRFWDTSSGNEHGVMASHKGPIWAVAVSADGKLMASGGRDRVVRLQSAAPPSLAAIPKDENYERDSEVGPPPFPPPLPEAELAILPSEVRAGDRLSLVLTVTNKGKGPLYRFQGKTKSHDPKLDGKVFYLGKIEPQESKTDSFTIDIPKDQSRQEIPLQIEFEEYNGFSPEGLQAVITIEGPPRPRLAYNYKIVDDGSGNSVGNGDGRIQTGEAVDLLLTLRNIGVVSAQDIWVEMDNPTGQHLEIRPGRIKFGLLNPDQSKQSRISFTVWPEYPHSQIAFKLFIQEKSQKVFLNEVLKMAVDSHPPSQIVTTNKLITVTEDSATILSGAGPESPVVASVEKGQSLAVTGELGDWYRVQLSDSEVGWITKIQASVVTQTAMGSMPIPKIQGLEASRSEQFITLSEELQRQRVEREQAEQALKKREGELDALKHRLDTMKEVQSTELSTVQEQLSLEQTVRAQAEKALGQYEKEFDQLRAKLKEATDYSGASSIRKAPPAIALASPTKNQQVKVARIQLVGAAASEKGIARIEVRVNNQLLVRRQSRDLVVQPTDQVVKPTLEFSEWIPLEEGPNTIKVMAFDVDQLASTQSVTVTRLVDRGKIWGVVIGISEYQDDGIRSLKYGDKDALAFFDYLHSHMGVPKNFLTLLINDQATLFNLKRTLGTDLKRKAGEKDTIFIFYAGHGAPEPDAASRDGDGLEKYLVPYDADPNDLYSTALPMREVETIFGRLSAERVIFVTDACYSGATGGRTFASASHRAQVSDTFLDRLSKSKGRVVLTASRANEVSEERDDLGHGVFTHYLLEGLKGKADTDTDGVITVDEAYAYVSRHVPQATGQNQHPVRKGEMEGQLVFGHIQ